VLKFNSTLYGWTLSSVGEHLLDVQRVRGSNPLASTILFALVAQLDSAFDSDSKGCRFKSCRARHGFTLWGCSSDGRALRWQRRGRGFEPLQLHHIYEKTVEIFDFLFAFHTHITIIVYDTYVQGRI
jgi:hypothetical protein